MYGSKVIQPMLTCQVVTRRSRALCVSAMNVEHEIGLLIVELTRLGKANPAFSGAVTVRRAPAFRAHTLTPEHTLTHARAAQVPFGVLVRDERCGDLFEALVGTLRAAKKRKVVDYAAEMLLQGAHDDVHVVLLKSA